MSQDQHNVGFGCREVSICGSQDIFVNVLIWDAMVVPQAPILGVSCSPSWLAGQHGGPTVLAACPGDAGWQARTGGITHEGG